ncbi:purine permease [Spiractinospora alimapuensis]|uniref:uracil-xanthine permease family protein n=1 Tax=Spiractinospora alimapuensis TaxID=2820884 RepID=UPI001F313A37|nr:nucleobase:cation symporter-2 family protein [Spiractinospora alimapuensis]QVQ50401.1 purine permease [Spiractinospora alimapuensis]
MSNNEHDPQASETSITYGVNDMPPLRKAIPLGIQHVLTMFASNVTVPILIAGAVGATVGETALLVQAALLCAGLTTLLQTVGIGRVGSRLPIVQGTSFGFLVVAVSVGPTYGLPAILGGAIVAGVVQCLMGLVMPWLKRLFPPLVSGIVVLTIGVGLFPSGLNLMAGGAGAEDYGSYTNLGFALFVFVLVIGISQFGRGFFATSAVLIGLTVGYLAAIPFGLVDFSGVAEAAWFDIPRPMQFGLSFPMAAVVAMAVMGIATTVETIGDLSAVTKGGAGREVTNREMTGGVLADGVGTIISPFLNAFPNTTYAQNVGLVTLTGVMSRHVVSIGAGFLLICALSPKLAAVITAMPSSVLGGAGIVMFGLVAASGIRLITDRPMSRRNLTIISASVGPGLGLAMVPDAIAVLPETLYILLETGIVPAATIAVILNLVIPDQADR